MMGKCPILTKKKFPKALTSTNDLMERLENSLAKAKVGSLNRSEVTPIPKKPARPKPEADK